MYDGLDWPYTSNPSYSFLSQRDPSLSRGSNIGRSKAGMARRRAEGVQIGPPTKSATVIDQIRELKKRGLSSYAIGKALRVSASTVAKYVLG
jgi:hypothetical protein